MHEREFPRLLKLPAKLVLSWKLYRKSLLLKFHFRLRLLAGITVFFQILNFSWYLQLLHTLNSTPSSLSLLVHIEHMCYKEASFPCRLCQTFLWDVICSTTCWHREQVADVCNASTCAPPLWHTSTHFSLSLCTICKKWVAYCVSCHPDFHGKIHLGLTFW